MISTIFIGFSFLANLFSTQPAQPERALLAEKSYSLEYRYPDKWVSNVFKDNILLALYYLRGNEKSSNVNWTEVEKPFHYEFGLEKDKTFAFQGDVLPEFEGRVSKTTGSNFSSYEGYKSDGWLIGDGVCQLASFINMAARQAGLSVLSPTNHNFAAIPEVPKEYGVAIFAHNPMQNLYVTNNKNGKITIAFDYKNDILTIRIYERKTADNGI